PAAVRPARAPAAGAAQRRDRFRHDRQPLVLRRDLAGSPADAARLAAGARPGARGVTTAWRVVIAGGGFGGLYAARKLERVLPAQSANVTLIADANFLLYTPLLPGAAAGTLEPRHVVVPLREELDSTDVRLGRVTGADPAERRLDYLTPDGREQSLSYDQLIVALGSVSRVLPIPGL